MVVEGGVEAVVSVEVMAVITVVLMVLTVVEWIAVAALIVNIIIHSFINLTD